MKGLNVPLRLASTINPGIGKPFTDLDDLCSFVVKYEGGFKSAHGDAKGGPPKRRTLTNIHTNLGAAHILEEAQGSRTYEVHHPSGVAPRSWTDRCTAPVRGPSHQRTVDGNDRGPASGTPAGKDQPWEVREVSSNLGAVVIHTSAGQGTYPLAKPTHCIYIYIYIYIL
eukprot:jgi/Botrbrau1/10162/Bobra.0121s0014.1